MSRWVTTTSGRRYLKPKPSGSGSHPAALKDHSRLPLSERKTVTETLPNGLLLTTYVEPPEPVAAQWEAAPEAEAKPAPEPMATRADPMAGPEGRWAFYDPDLGA